MYESSCFAGDNDPLEIRSLRRSGPSKIPQVQQARQAFPDQPIIAEQGMLSGSLFDGNPITFGDLLKTRAREPGRRHLRLDLGIDTRLDGRWVGAPQRAPSSPVNPWEYPVSQTDRNYNDFIPMTQDMLDKACEVVGLAFAPKNLDFRPDGWRTAYPVPYCEKTLTLSE